MYVSCVEIKATTTINVNLQLILCKDGSPEGIYDNTYKIAMYVDNSTTVSLMPTAYYEQATFLHHLPKYDATEEIYELEMEQLMLISGQTYNLMSKA